MGYLNLRNDTGFCNRCESDSDDCNCHMILCWEGEHLLDGEDPNMDRMIEWGCLLAWNGAPPRFDGPVLRELPESMARAMEEEFLRLAAMPECDELPATDPLEVFECASACEINFRKTIYEAWVEAAALHVHSRTVCIGGLGSGGIYDNLEVENPVDTQARMRIILAPAMESLLKLMEDAATP